jgi:hypothetical protein
LGLGPNTQQGGHPNKLTARARQPSFKARLTAEDACWSAVTLSQWYGQAKKAAAITSGTAVWFHKGLPVLSPQRVMARDPQHKLTYTHFSASTSMPSQKRSWDGAFAAGRSK